MRRTKTFTVQGDKRNRDAGKAFHIEEMPAWDFDIWRQKAVFAITKSGAAVPPDFLESGLPGLLAFGVQALFSANYADVQPLLEELIGCAQFVPDSKNPAVRIPWPTYKHQIEEAGTFNALRMEVIEVHVGFSVAAALREFLAAKKVPPDGSPDIATSPSPLGTSSLPN